VVTCNNFPCIPCLFGQTTCCDKATGNLCTCANPGQESVICK
jgi:hypothetical protein